MYTYEDLAQALQNFAQKHEDTSATFTSSGKGWGSVLPWKRKGHKYVSRGAKKEFRWFKVDSKLIVFLPGQYKHILSN